MTLSGQPGSAHIPPMPAMQPSYAAPPMFPGQQPVSLQPAELHAPSQQMPQFGMQPVPQQAPQFTLPPADSAHSQRISKLAEYTSRNGPAFEGQVREKQALNPEYLFLQGGEGSDYYQWCLFCYTNGIPIDQPQQEGLLLAGAPSGHGPAHVGMMFQQPGGLPPPAGGLPPPSEFQPPAGLPPPSGLPPPAITSPQQHIPSPLPQPGGPIPPEVASGFDQVLHVLQGSQESIKASSAWFLACRTHAAGMVEMMLHRVQQLHDFQAQLHVVYLINDLFFTAGETPPSDQQLRDVFKPHLTAFFTAAYRTAACSQEAFGQLCSLLDLWSNRGVMDLATVAGTRARMCDVGPPAPVPIPVPHQPFPAVSHFPQGMATGPDAWAAPGQHHVPVMGGGPHPVPFAAQRPPPSQGGFHRNWGPPMGATDMGVHGPAGHSKMPAPPPEKEPYDILSFPAGLIPKLARRHLQYEREYTPLRKDDIDSEPPPPLPPQDAYLQGRLQRFYAELAQYKPGVSRAAYEERLVTLGDGLLPPEPDPALKSSHITASRETNMRNDGTYTGRDAGRSGLGASEPLSGDGDLYDHYRQQRSGRYHSIMASKSTNPNRPPQGH